jgi:hypothetical protein
MVRNKDWIRNGEAGLFSVCFHFHNSGCHLGLLFLVVWGWKRWEFEALENDAQSAECRTLIIFRTVSG